MDEYERPAEDYMKGPYWLIDILPEQVPTAGGGNYFAVERYLRGSTHIKEIYKRFAGLLIKLNCYYSLKISRSGLDGWSEENDPTSLKNAVKSLIKPRVTGRYLYVKAGDALIMINGDDLFMTLYGADDELLALIKEFASAEGLFVWLHEEEK